MRAFANFILRGRLQALLITVVATALMALVPLLSHVAGGALALVALRKGVREGALIAVGAGLALLALSALGRAWGLQSGLVHVVVMLLALLVWVPVLIAAGVLRSTRSLELALCAVGMFAALAVIGFHLTVGDATAWWRGVLQNTLQPLLQQMQLPISGENGETMIEAMARMMTGVLAATVIFTAMINLFIGRWLQALVFNPGGFGEEFRRLRLGRPVAVAAAIIIVLASFATGWVGGLAINLSFVVGAMFFLHGLALVHGAVALLRAHAAWLIALYVLMAIALPQVGLVLSAAGFADSWLDIRSKLAARKAGGGGAG